ncbi:ATP-binding protein, partial [Escherichia coli]|uniref:ATP-binding protein n=1 Tax=Escherichia coli TaxID=562 RepID=UPI003F67A252
MNHLYEQLTALKLTGFRDALKKQLAQPGTYQELGFEERLSLLTAEELTCRENRKAERLIKHARFRLNRPGFPGECFICELRLPDHRFRWKHNKLFL